MDSLFIFSTDREALHGLSVFVPVLFLKGRAMAAYPVMDLHNNVIGSMALYEDEISELLMEGQRFELGCMYASPTRTREKKKLMAFLVFPMPAIKKDD